MKHETEHTIEVRRTIERLIENGSTYDLEYLDRLYHERLQVFVIDDSGAVTVLDKAANMSVFRAKRDGGAEPLSRWARFNDVQTAGHSGFVIVTQRMNLRGRAEEEFVLAIHLVFEDARWQVTHETVFVRPPAPDVG
jgi:hypothetical protein